MRNDFSWYDDMYSEGGIPVNSLVKEYLSESVKWAKYVCILFCVLIPAMVFKGLIIIDFFNLDDDYNRHLSHSETLSTTIGNIVLPALCIFPVVWGFKSVINIKKACRTNDQDDLERGIEALRICFFMVVVVAVFYLLFSIWRVFDGDYSYLLLLFD